MAFVAAHTERLRLATGIIIVPLRNPVVLAKQLASLDALSNGRLIFGVGIGNLSVEFAALGMPFDHKGLRAEEALGVMKALWTMERPRFPAASFTSTVCVPSRVPCSGRIRRSCSAARRRMRLAARRDWATDGLATGSAWRPPRNASRVSAARAPNTAAASKRSR
jgi:alkanesulfonate monooxygenase SsuD/methylene tetrahydromethanopterin reductase-like flavin-dependent oxidoreductase (luciferase family)